MGYTHYWYKIPTISCWDFKQFLNDFNKVLDDNPGLESLITDYDKTIESSLFFNGIGENAHETFYFEKKVDVNEGYIQKNNDGKIFSFCKTARKPYDIVVCIALIIAKKKFGVDIKVASDGSDEPDMWQEARQVCQNTLGYGQRFDFKPNGDAVFRRKRVEEMTIEL